MIDYGELKAGQRYRCALHDTPDSTECDLIWGGDDWINDKKDMMVDLFGPPHSVIWEIDEGDEDIVLYDCHDRNGNEVELLLCDGWFLWPDTGKVFPRAIKSDIKEISRWKYKPRQLDNLHRRDYDNSSL